MSYGGGGGGGGYQLEGVVWYGGIHGCRIKGRALIGRGMGGGGWWVCYGGGGGRVLIVDVMDGH